MSERKLIQFGSYPQTIVKNQNDLKDNKKYIQVKEDWFEIEPISWIVLEETEKSYLLLSEKILDCLRFSENRNNYENSDIRFFLNDYFYHSAFSEDEVQFIEQMNVRNDGFSTGVYNNEFVCPNTCDFVTLLSYQEANEEKYGFINNQSRKASLTDYASHKTDGTLAKELGTWFWWLRSPDEDYSDYVKYIGYKGEEDSALCTIESYGVRPLIRIKKGDNNETKTN